MNQRGKNKLERHYKAVLNELTDEIFERAAKRQMTWIQLAEAANLCYGTVAKLGNRVTRFPHFRSVVKLGAAVGMYQIRLVVDKRVRRKAA
mgnify:CR=1 FL=1